MEVFEISTGLRRAGKEKLYLQKNAYDLLIHKEGKNHQLVYFASITNFIYDHAKQAVSVDPGIPAMYCTMIGCFSL